MSQRTRYILIIVILVAVVGIGLLAYFLTRVGAPTTAGLGFGVANDQEIVLHSNVTGKLSWLDCTKGTEFQQNYDLPFGQGFDQTHSCTNIDSQAHTLTVEVYDLIAPAIFDPPYDSSQTNKGICYANEDMIQHTGEWPVAFGQQEMLPVIANRVHTTSENWSCLFLQNQAAEIWSLQEPIVPTDTLTIEFGAGEHKVVTTSHDGFDKCSYYQIDDVFIDETGTAQMALGNVHRSFGDVTQCPIQPARELGNLEVRMWQEIDGNGEYSTPTTGGTDTPFPSQTVTIRDSQGVALNSALCSNGVTTGGAGRLSCFQIPVGVYSVKVNNPNATLYSGPIVDSNANPAPGEQHNANGDLDLTLTVVPGPQPQGVGNDKITFFDYGFKDKTIGNQVGNLEVRIYEDVDKNNEYSTPAAGGTDNPFAFHDLKVINASTNEDMIAAGKCDQTQGTQTGGAGRFDCWQIPTGQYRVTVANPDTSVYGGPVVDTTANPASGEQHNANGDAVLTLTVVEGPTPQGVGNDIITFYDYGYTKKQGPIVTASETCTVTKTVTDQTGSDEGSPDDPKVSNSGEGERLTFTISYTCDRLLESDTVVITDDYDETLTAVDDASISGTGVHDATQNIITWTYTGETSRTGTETFESVIPTSLAVGTYVSPNDVTISRNGELDDQDQTITNITVDGVPVVPDGGTTGPTALPQTAPGQPPRTPDTGVEANLLALLLSLALAAGVTVFTLKRNQSHTVRNK